MEDIIDMYQDGKSAKQIATHFNHPYQRIYERIKAYYGVKSLTDDTRTSETRAKRREEREEEELDWFRGLLDDPSNNLVRMVDKFPPLKDGEVKEKVVENFINYWNKRNKGHWDRNEETTVYPNKMTLKSMCELNGLTQEQGKRILYNDPRCKQ